MSKRRHPGSLPTDPSASSRAASRNAARWPGRKSNSTQSAKQCMVFPIDGAAATSRRCPVASAAPRRICGPSRARFHPRRAPGRRPVALATRPRNVHRSVPGKLPARASPADHRSPPARSTHVAAAGSTPRQARSKARLGCASRRFGTTSRASAPATRRQSAPSILLPAGRTTSPGDTPAVSLGQRPAAARRGRARSATAVADVEHVLPFAVESGRRHWVEQARKVVSRRAVEIELVCHLRCCTSESPGSDTMKSNSPRTASASLTGKPAACRRAPGRWANQKRHSASA